MRKFQCDLHCDPKRLGRILKIALAPFPSAAQSIPLDPYSLNTHSCGRRKRGKTLLCPNSKDKPPIWKSKYQNAEGLNYWYKGHCISDDLFSCPNFRACMIMLCCYRLQFISWTPCIAHSRNPFNPLHTSCTKCWHLTRIPSTQSYSPITGVPSLQCPRGSVESLDTTLALPLSRKVTFSQTAVPQRRASLLHVALLSYGMAVLSGYIARSGVSSEEVLHILGCRLPYPGIRPYVYISPYLCHIPFGVHVICDIQDMGLPYPAP